MKRFVCCLAVLAALVMPAAADIPSGFFTGAVSPTVISLAAPDLGAHGMAMTVPVPEPGFYPEFAVNLAALTLLILVRRKRQA